MPDTEPKSSLDLLSNRSTLVPITSGNPTSKQNQVDPITEFVLSQKTPKYGVNTQPLTLSDVQSELNPRFDTVRYGYNNEDAAAQSQGFFDKAFNGVAKGVGLAATTFASGISDIVYGIPSAIANGDITKIWDNDITKGLQAFNKKVDDEYLPNYYSDQEKNAAWYGIDNLFTANFLFDKLIKNAGFAVGAIYSGNVVGKGLSIGGKALGTMFSSTAEYAQAYKSFSRVNNTLARLFSQGKNIEAAEALKGSISTLPELEETTKALTKIATQQNNIAAVSDFTNRTIRALYSSAGESNFEALGTATAYKESLINEYKEKWGIDPSAQDITKIDELSKEVGKSSFLANMAVLSLTEYFQMPTLLGSSYKTSKAAANTFRTTNEVIGEAGKYAAKSSGILKKTGRFIESYIFDPKEAAQEYLQTAIDKGTQEYYNKAYKGEEVNAWTQAFDSVTGIWGTKEGMESALLGGLSGGLMQIKDKFKENRKRNNNTSEFLSKIQGTTFEQAFEDRKNSAQRHINLENEATVHAEEGNKLSWLDNKFDQAHNYIAPRIKYGRTDLIKQDIAEKKGLAMTEEGYKQLQATGEAPKGLTREDYVQKLDEFEQQVKDTIQLHEASYLSYGGQTNEDGTRKYSDAVIDKLIYAAAKITDYDKRIPELSQELTKKGIQLQSILQEVIGEKFENSPYEEARKELDANQNITDEQRKDLIQQLLDVRELTKRRKEYIDEYNSIRATPENYVETPKTTTIPTAASTVEVTTKDKNVLLEVGEKYFLSGIESKTKQGFIQKENPLFTLISHNEDGTLTIQDEDGKTRNIDKKELEKYSLGKYSTIENNPKAKFYFDNRKTIFEYKFKSGKKPGILRYSDKADQLIFEYFDKGKLRQIPVNGKDFSYELAKKAGFNEPIITSTNKTLTKEEQKSIETETSPVTKFTERFTMLADLVNNTRDSLNSTKQNLESKKKQLSELEESFKNLEAVSKETTQKGNPKKVAKAALKTLKVLGETKETLLQEIQDLENQQDELEASLPYFEEVYENSDLLPENLRDALPQIKDEIDQLEELIDNTSEAIKENKSLISKIDQALTKAYSILKDFITRIKEENTFTDLDEYQSKLEKYLGEEGAKQFIDNKEGYTQAIKSIQLEIAEFEGELSIPINEQKLKALEENLSELQKGIDELITKQIAKSKLLEFFENKIAEYENKQKEIKKLAEDKAIQEKYFVQQKAQEQNSGIATEDKIPAKEPSKKDLINGPISGTDPAWEDITVDDNFHRRHQTFEFNMTSNDPAKFNQENKAKLRIIPVSSVTAKELGFAEDWIDPQYRFDGKNVDTAAIRYVYVIQERKQLFFTDVNGNKLGEVGKESVDTTKIIYTNAENTTFKDGQTGEFTNKNGLDKETVRKAWRDLRSQLFKIKASEIRDYAYTFRTSRGFLNQTQGVTRNTNLFDAGIITAQDLNNVVIDIPGNSQKFPKGVPMFNYAGNTFFLNNRKLSEQEATQVYDILVYAATHKEGFSNRVFDYLKNVIYFSTSRDENKQLKRNQIFLKKDEEFPALVIGENEVEIQFIPFSTSDGNNLVDKKAEIIGFLKEAYHHVNSSTLSKQKEGITKFNELSVEGDEIKIKEWPSYQHYLLEQRKGEQSPLTANVAIPQEREVPIKEKYPIVEFKSFDIGTPAPTTKQETLSDRGDIFDTTSNIFRNADNTISRVEVTSIKYTSEFKVGETTFKAGDEIKHIVPADAIKVIEDNLKAKHSPKVEVKEKSEKLIVDFQGFKITMIVDRDANKAATKLTVESMIATSGVPGTTEGQDYKDAYKGILPQIEAGFLAKLNAKKETEVVQKQDEVIPVITDIEKRRQELIDSIEQIEKPSTDGGFRPIVYYSALLKNNKFRGFFGPSKIDAIVDIKAGKYDAELAALEGTTTVSDKKAEIERRRQEELKKKTSFKNTNHIEGERYSINIASKFGFDGYDVDVSGRANTTTGFLYNNTLSQHFDTIEEAKQYAEEILNKDKDYLDKINAKYDAELATLQNAPKTNVDDLLDDSDGEFEDAREATDNYKTYHGDKKVETEDVSFMLPQVKQSMVKNLIDMIGGGKAWGMARSRMMEIYEGAPFGTKYHESFEQVFNWILSPSEQNDLWEEFKTKDGTFITYKGETKPYSEATFKEAKEEMAENFIEYKQTAVKPKPSNKIIQFFKDLWNFLKEMLNAHPATIANVFDKLNKGVYRIANIRATKEEEYRERSVQGESVSFVNTMLSGMTADMFIAKWQDDVGIIMDLEENPGEAEGKLFSELKSRMVDYFENPKNRAGVITYYKFLIKKETDPAKIQELKDSLEEVLKAWSRVKNQWTNYTEELKSFLRTFDISFQVDDEGNLALDSNIDENEINNRDYMEDRMTINAKNSASKVVKLLMATISDSQFRGVVEKSIKAVIDNSTVPVRDNSMRMKMLVPYAKLFNYILHNTTGLQGIYSIVGKLQEISENTNIKQNANVKGVLDRIKFNTENYFKGFSLPQIKMILKLESALSKYKPLFMSQELTEEGKTINKPSSKFGRIEQLTTEWANNLKSSPYATVTGDTIQLSEKLFSFDPFIFVKNLGIPITKSTGITKEEKEEIEKEITAIQGFLKPYIKEPLPLIEKGKNTGVDGRLKRLAKFYVENVEGESTESQHYNKNGKVTANFVLPNFISYIIGDANNSASIEEFIQKNPQYNDLYMKDSYILNNIIYKDGKLNKKLNIVVVEGKSSYGENRPTDKMVEGERMLYEINNNLKGIFYTLMPSDSKTEYAVDWGNIVDKEFFNPTFKERATDSYVDKLFNHLLNEIELAKDYNSRSFIKALTRTLKGEKNSLGKQLRFFKHILSKESVDKIQNSLINEKKTLTPEELTKFKEVFKKEIAAYITKQASLNINDLTSWGLIKDGTLYGFDNDFMTSTFNKNGKQHNLTPQQIQELFEFREMNYVFSNIEMHKMFFNDPYQSKDALKRTKSFLNGREYSHVDTLNDEQGLNEALKQQLNKGLQPTDIGWHNFKNHLNSVNIKDIKTVSTVYESLSKVLKDASKYLSMEIADAQSWAIGGAYREILYKAGGRFTSQQEELHQWLMAWERRDKNKYSSEILRQSDNLILSNPIPNSDKHRLHILKPIVSGTKLVDGIAVQYLSKTSTAPLYYYFVKGGPLEQVYNKMQEKNIDFLGMQSANKIGELTNNTISLFNAEGSISEEFETVTSTPFLFKHFGIQVDTAAIHTSTTQGSQLTKLAIVDLMEAGIPVDFIKENAQLSREDLEEAWNNSDKSQSKVWNAVQEHNKALIGLAIKRTQTVLDKLGIKKEEFGYSFKDKEIVAEFILNELERRELPDNISQGIATKFNPDTQTNEFTTPLEANVNYQKIKQILWSVIQKGVTQPKINGAPAIQMSVAGFGTIREVEINGKKVLVDDTLKFYSSKDNGVTDACEIYLPYFFGEKLRNSPQFKEMEEKEFHEKVITFLNTTEEGQSLLKGIGFRIPTQALNSIEFFKVKKFLAPQLGDVIVLPAEITTKAGSDFDVDKLNIYLRNWYIGSKGFPKPVKFKNIDTNNEQQLTDLYKDTLKNKRKEWESNQAYDRLMSKIDNTQEDSNYIPTLEEFIAESKGKDAMEVNSIEALENRYIDSLETLISLPENFKALVTPNDASQLSTISDEIQVLMNNVDEDITPGHLISSNFMAKKRNTMLSSKNSVGISAVSATNLATNQFKRIILLIADKFVKKNVKIRLPHNKLGSGISLGHITNAEGDSISNINAQFTDGTVDVAKKEWLPRMGFTDRTISTALLMNKWGTPPRHIAFFINQPAIQKYLKEREIQENISKITRTKARSANESQTDVIATFTQTNLFSARKIKPDVYNLKEKGNLGLEDMIGKDLNSLTDAQKLRQVQILDDYIAYQEMSGQLLKYVQGNNWDTSKLSSPEDVYSKILDTELAEEQPIIGSLDGTYFSEVKKSVTNLSEALQTLFFTQKGKALSILQDFAKSFKNQIGIDGDTYTKYMNKVENSLIDFLVQTSSLNGVELHTYIKPLLQSNFAAANYVKKLQQDILDPSHPLKNNKFLLNLSTDIDVKHEKASATSIVEPDFDTFTSDSLTDQFRELLEDNSVVKIDNNPLNNRLVSQVFQNVLLAQILQSGSNRKQGSFFHLIPNEVYTKYVNSALTDVNLDAFKYNALFYRNNFRDNILVPALTPDYDSGEFDSFTYDMSNVLGNSIVYADAFKYKNFPVVKIVSRENKKVTYRIFKRVDIENSPVIIKKTKEDFYDPEDEGKENVIYKEITPLGDGNKAQEYYSDSTTSLFNPKITEVADESIVKELEKQGKKISYKNLPLMRESEENDVPLDMEQLSLFDKPIVNTTPINIWAGSNENTILSNLAVRPFVYQNDNFNSVEEYFQLQKANYLKEELYVDGNEKKLQEVIEHNNKIMDQIIKNENNPFKIKQLGREFRGLDTKKWDSVALDEMRKVLKISFEQNPKALQALLATGNSNLTHIQDKGRWNTDFPKLLMEVREELKKENYQIDTFEQFKENLTTKDC